MCFNNIKNPATYKMMFALKIMSVNSNLHSPILKCIPTSIQKAPGIILIDCPDIKTAMSSISQAISVRWVAD